MIRKIKLYIVLVAVLLSASSCLDKYPQDTSVRLLLARALSWNGNIKEAEEEYRKILDKSHEVGSKS